MNGQTSFFNKIVGYNIIFTAVFSFAAILATFLLSNSNLDFQTKTAIFLAIAIIYPLSSAAFYLFQKQKFGRVSDKKSDSIFDSEIIEKLSALEEANEFFGASLKSSDMFRLVTSRVAEIAPFAACVLYLRDENGENLRIKYAAGERSREFMDYNWDLRRSLAEKSFSSGEIEFDSSLAIEKLVFSPDILRNFKSAAAVTLTNRGENIGVLTLYGAAENDFGEKSVLLLQAIGERIAPLFANSFAFEKSLSNALTDTLTNLPNERAFFLILENQLAESHRFRDERPLTILALDIENFAEINVKYGHAAGDRLLAFTAEIIKKQLRQMDVLTRSAGDEFLIILPTANEKTAAEIIARIRRALVVNPLRMTENENVNPAINFGAATFWRDGETANQLLKTALLRKEQEKSTETAKIIWFPKEFVN